MYTGAKGAALTALCFNGAVRRRSGGLTVAIPGWRYPFTPRRSRNRLSAVKTYIQWRDAGGAVSGLYGARGICSARVEVVR